MIDLSQALIVGRGLHRDVYQHPRQPEYCLKVRVDRNRVNRGKVEEKREQSYYRLLQKRQIPWDGLPQFYGNVETSEGWAAMFDLIRDTAGTTSETLEFYFSDPAVTAQYQTQLVAAIQQLKAYLLRHNIITMSLKPKNIVLQLQENDVYRCVIVDNIGNSDWIPLMTYVPLFGRRKIERKWADFKRRLLRYYADNPAAVRVIEQI